MVILGYVQNRNHKSIVTETYQQDKPRKASSQFGHNSQSPYPGASKSVASSLKCTGPYHRLFLEYVPKTSRLKENILRKKSIVEQRFI